MSALADLVAQLLADGELDADDLERIAQATARERVAIGEERAWAETAHVHAVAHAPVVSFDDDKLEAYLADPDRDDAGDVVPPGMRLPEQVDASDVVCHDCGRALVSDAGSARILVCPSLHRRRPPRLVPADPDHAVECGRVREP